MPNILEICKIVEGNHIHEEIRSFLQEENITLFIKPTPEIPYSRFNPTIHYNCTTNFSYH